MGALDERQADVRGDFRRRREERLKERHRYRSLRLASGIDFASNDYLGLSRHPALRQSIVAALERGPAGAGGSRLLRGHHAGEAVGADPHAVHPRESFTVVETCVELEYAAAAQAV